MGYRHRLPSANHNSKKSDHHSQNKRQLKCNGTEVYGYLKHKLKPKQVLHSSAFKLALFKALNIMQAILPKMVTI